ncbi:MAG: hypothetical protein IPM11_01160 [Micropruina sp.]|nr:hypothetical protein [Micropruina sp.]
MNDILKTMRADPRVKKPEGRVIDRKDRVEATHAADARKARQIVRSLRSGSLPHLAAEIAKVTSDLGVKHGMQEALERYVDANNEYRRMELKPVDRIVEWMGLGHGVMPPMPAGSPEHKIEFAAAWNALLACVNEATKVGVHKPHREHPIMLKVDLEEPSSSLILPGSVEWD